jgi:hypothetical protein
MPRLAAATLAALLVASTPGCVTGYGLYKHNQDVTTANLVEAAAIDVGAFSYFMFAAENFSGGSAVLTGIALTAVDFGIACLLGTCQVLHP